MTTLIEQLDQQAEAASERPWQTSRPGGALVTQGRCASPAAGAEDREYYGGALVGESICRADQEFIAALANAWPAIRAALEAAKALHDAHEACGRRANGSNGHLVAIAQQEAAHVAVSKTLAALFQERALAVRESQT